MEYFAKVVEYFLKVMEYFPEDGLYCQNVVRERTGQGCFVESGLFVRSDMRNQGDFLMYVYV